MAESDRVFACPECGKHFDKSQGLGAHRNRAHGVKGTSKRNISRRANQQREAAVAPLHLGGEDRILKALLHTDVELTIGKKIDLFLLDLAEEILSLPKIAPYRGELEELYWTLLRFHLGVRKESQDA